MTRRRWVLLAATVAVGAAAGTVAFVTYATVAVIRADEERQRG